MERISLEKDWLLKEPLALGGFGQIFIAEGVDGSSAVIKLIPKEPGASRELLFGSLPNAPRIIPILDSGEWKERFVLVMPRAEKSLRQYIAEFSNKVPFGVAINVLKDMAEALATLSEEVVHRDVKPENVLLYKGNWCLADFGIARYAEATTASDTRKYAMTSPYAAPEQWRGDRATPATDIYALGIVAFELFMGHLPFEGPDYREQHLKNAPPLLMGIPPLMGSLVNECLYKSHSARPTATNILARLQSADRTASPSLTRLQAANHAVVKTRAEAEAKRSAQREVEESRRVLFDSAVQSASAIQTILKKYAEEHAPATTGTESSEVNLRLGQGVLFMPDVEMAPANCLALGSHQPPFDVIAYTAIAVKQNRDRQNYEGRSHALWFCDAYEEGIYRWYELAFMISPSVPMSSFTEPFALRPTEDNAAAALSPISHIRQIAWQPIPIDQGDETVFIERWMDWFAQASDGTLARPNNMPENSGGKHRNGKSKAV